MILLEIPKLTLSCELEVLNSFSPDEHSDLFIAGAKASLQWLLDGKTPPSIALIDLFSGPTEVH